MAKLYAPPTQALESRDFKPYWDVDGPRLNIGCGNDYRPGWVNADLYNPRADVKLDITAAWDGLAKDFGLIWANQILEHLPPVNAGGRDSVLHFLKESHRHLRPGGRVMVAVPYPDSLPCRANLTHYRRFAPESFHFLEAGSESTLAAANPGFRILKRKIVRTPPGAGLVKAGLGVPKPRAHYPNFGKKTGLAWVLEKTGKPW